MSSFDRRAFLKASVAGAGVVAAAPGILKAEESTKSFKGTDIIELGKTGIKVSRLAQGTGYNGVNHSSEQTRQGKEKFNALLQRSIEKGIQFMDMADLYGSHEFVRDAVKGISRDKLTYASKIMTWDGGGPYKRSGGAKEEVTRFLKELKTDYLDICLVHGVNNANWVTQFVRMRDELSELKDKGHVRAVGCSCHDLGALKVAAEHPWVQVIFARVNHKCTSDYFCDGTVEEISSTLKTARKNGKVVIGMKIFGAGKLVKPEEKDASLKHVFTNELVDAITIGTMNPSQVDDTLERMSKVSMS